ncbi:MAG: hypothetical protein GY858_06970 [Candidatus Omnitrophica bacterium]|nr:hypothetical protein [Candidatus Omnitrophota bacterium]
MKNAFLTFLILYLFLAIIPGYSQNLSYEYLMDIAMQEFEDVNYEEALRYFQMAENADKNAQEPIYYINLIKRTMEGMVVGDQPPSSEDYLTRQSIYESSYGYEYFKADNKDYDSGTSTVVIQESENVEQKNRSKLINNTLSGFTREKALEEIQEKRTPLQLPLAKEEEPVKEAKAKPVKEAKAKPALLPPRLTGESKSFDKKKAPEKVSPGKDKVVALDAAKKEEFPYALELPIKHSLKINSEKIKRFLVVSPGFVSVERLSGSSLRVFADSLGKTFLHVWDNNGRWTFDLKIVPHKRLVKIKRNWEPNEGFKFSYTNNWRSYYEGDKLSNLDRQTLSIDGSMKMVGPTPYGEFDSSVNWARLNDDNEVTGYSAGLRDGRFLGFKDFYIRGFDFSKSFSPLSFPGKTLHGVFFKSPAFNEAIEYSVFSGREKQGYYSYLSPGLTTKKDAYIEGGQLKLFPHGTHRLFFNYAHSYGSDRQDYLRDNVFSLQSEHRLGKVSFYSEVASDGAHIAANFSSFVELPKMSLRFAFRDIEKKFVTITGRASNTGEIGGIFGVNWRPLSWISLNSNLDIYRDRDSYNPGNRRALNYDYSGTANIILSPRASLTNSIYYINTPGLAFPQRNFTGNTIYAYTFDLPFFGERSLGTHFGYTYQKNINPLSPDSDYRRDSYISGIRLKLARGLSYRLNYARSHVEELNSSQSSDPEVIETGLDLHHRLNPKLDSTWRVSYRDERNAGGTHSFLAGEDSAQAGVNLTFTPHEDWELFCSGQVRKVWPEESSQNKYVEADLRFGARISWESFFRWSARACVEGVVFKDANGNAIFDIGEDGLAGIKVVVGPKEVITNASGRYRVMLRAKKAQAILDLNTVPKGYVITTPSLVDLDTAYGGVHKVDFGISSQAGIYGVVFYDADGNGQLGRSDTPIPSVKLTLDNKRNSYTNRDGAYFFGKLLAGDYEIKLDVNSIPLEYLPQVSIKKTVTLSEGITNAYHIPLDKK